MFWKLFIRMMGRRALSYTRAVAVKEKVYIVQIGEYESSDALIRKVDKASDEATSKALNVRF